jgi:Sigma-70, region 4
VNQTATGPDRIAAELAADLDAGFAALFEAHQHVLFSTALRICGGLGGRRGPHGHGVAARLPRAADLLPDRQRVAVVLRHVADLPIAEVASVLGCPPGTAKSHMSRGLRRLRELKAARVRPTILP